MLWATALLLGVSAPVVGHEPANGLLSSRPKSGRTLIVGGDMSYPPYEYIDANGEPAGYNVDLTRAIARAMGVDVEFRLGPWTEIRRQLADGEIDALQGMFYSTQRDAEFDFSPPHTVVHHAAFIREGGPEIRSVDDLRGRRILVQEGDIMHDFLVDRRLTEEILPKPSQEEMLRALASGEGDCAIGPRLQCLYWIDELGLSNLEPTGPAFMPSEYCYAVDQGDTETLALFSEGLAIIRNTGEYRQIHDRWLGPLDGDSLPLRTILLGAAAVAGPVLLVVGGAWLWNRSLRRKVASRTAELQREIAERKQAEAALQRQAEDLAAAQNIAQLGSWSLDPTTGMRTWSPEMFRIYGLPASGGVPAGDLFYRHVHPDDRERLREELGRCEQTGRACNLEYRVLRAEDRERNVLAMVRAERDSEGTVVRLHGTTQDITDRLAAEQRRQTLEARMQSVRRLESLGVLAGGIAHDFNNLLAAILSNLELARMHDADSQARADALEEIRQATDRCTDLCRQMLAFSGRGASLLKPVNPGELVRQAAAIAEPSLPTDARLSIDLAEGLPAIEGDEDQLREMVVNLLTNAAEALPPSGGRVEVATQTIMVDHLQDLVDEIDEPLRPGPHIEVRISDNGEGISPEVRQRMFEPFFSTRFAGRGLGLGVVLGVVRAHGGGIRVHSSPGTGTTVLVLLPIDHVPRA